MSNNILPDGRDTRPRLTPEQDQMRTQGLRILARIIVRHRITCQREAGDRQRR